MLKANFFKVEMQRVSVTLYHVNFVPDIQISGIKRNLITQQKIGSYLFDGGNMLYLLNPLPQETTLLKGRTREGQEHTMEIRQRRQIHYTEGSFLTVMNLVIRDCMRELKLQLVGRDFYDPQAAVRF